jgi:hypothetical protein
VQESYKGPEQVMKDHSIYGENKCPGCGNKEVKSFPVFLDEFDKVILSSPSLP